MYVDVLPIGPLQTNCYVVTCRETLQCAVIDPGWNDPIILQTGERRHASIVAIINTHAHWDHIGGNASLARQTGAPLFVPEGDVRLLRAKGGADLWQIPIEPSPEPSRLLKAGDIIEVGAMRFEVLFTPGHTPGHICLFEARNKALFDGDVLFNQGIGRADLPGGNMAQLLDSIKNIVLQLPEETVVYPGHGPSTTVGHERHFNPFLTD